MAAEEKNSTQSMPSFSSSMASGRPKSNSSAFHMPSKAAGATSPSFRPSGKSFVMPTFKPTSVKPVKPEEKPTEAPVKSEAPAKVIEGPVKASQEAVVASESATIETPIKPPAEPEEAREPSVQPKPAPKPAAKPPVKKEAAKPAEKAKPTKKSSHVPSIRNSAPAQSNAPGGRGRKEKGGKRKDSGRYVVHTTLRKYTTTEQESISKLIERADEAVEQKLWTADALLALAPYFNDRPVNYKNIREALINGGVRTEEEIRIAKAGGYHKYQRDKKGPVTIAAGTAPENVRFARGNATAAGRCANAFRAILNKVTAETLDASVDEMMKVFITFEEHKEGKEEDNHNKMISETACFFVENAIMNPKFSLLYARLIKRLRDKFTALPEDAPGSSFVVRAPRRSPSFKFSVRVLRHCRDVLKSRSSDGTDAGTTVPLALRHEEGLDDDEVDYRALRRRNRNLGNMKFLGELFTLGIVTHQPILEIIARLFYTDHWSVYPYGSNIIPPASTPDESSGAKISQSAAPSPTATPRTNLRLEWFLDLRMPPFDATDENWVPMNNENIENGLKLLQRVGSKLNDLALKTPAGFVSNVMDKVYQDLRGFADNENSSARLCFIVEDLLAWRSNAFAADDQFNAANIEKDAIKSREEVHSTETSLSAGSTPRRSRSSSNASSRGSSARPRFFGAGAKKGGVIGAAVDKLKTVGVTKKKNTFASFASDNEEEDKFDAGVFEKIALDVLNSIEVSDDKYQIEAEKLLDGTRVSSDEHVRMGLRVLFNSLMGEWCLEDGDYATKRMSRLLVAWMKTGAPAAFEKGLTAPLVIQTMSTTIGENYVENGRWSSPKAEQSALCLFTDLFYSLLAEKCATLGSLATFAAQTPGSFRQTEAMKDLLVAILNRIDAGDLEYYVSEAASTGSFQFESLVPAGNFSEALTEAGFESVVRMVERLRVFPVIRDGLNAFKTETDLDSYMCDHLGDGWLNQGDLVYMTECLFRVVFEAKSEKTLNAVLPAWKTLLERAFTSGDRLLQTIVGAWHSVEFSKCHLLLTPAFEFCFEAGLLNDEHLSAWVGKRCFGRAKLAHKKAVDAVDVFLESHNLGPLAK